MSRRREKCSEVKCIRGLEKQPRRSQEPSPELSMLSSARNLDPTFPLDRQALRDIEKERKASGGQRASGQKATAKPSSKPKPPGRAAAAAATGKKK